MYFYAARQPIFNQNKQLMGYELLFRDGVDNVFPNTDGDEATSKLIEGSQFNFGLEDLTCLLYTSPSPRDRQKSRMPSSA